MRVGRTLSVLALICFVSWRAAGDVFWRVADSGPSTPDVSNILGDDSRTLAFTATGVHEYRFGAWTRVPLSSPDGKAEVPGVPFFAGGAFFALETSGGYPSPRTLYRLSSNTWQQLAMFTTSGEEVTHDASFLYAVSGQFNECTPTGAGACAPDSPARLFTISLADGSRRDGPLMPACFGRLVAAGGTVYFVALPPPCGGPSARRVHATVGTPLYRLDGGAWTALAPLTDYVESEGFYGTPRGLWIAVPGTNLQSAVRLLSAFGLSAPMLVPRDADPFLKSPVEWGAEIFYVTDDPSANIFHLVNGAFVPFSPLPAMFFPYGRQVEIYAAGTKLFATGDGYDPQVLQAGLWAETPGIEGTAGADTYFVSASSAFASRGGTFWKRIESGWTRLPRPPIGTQGLTGVVWQERAVVIDQGAPGQLLVYSDSSGSWETLVQSGPVESLLVSGSALCTADSRQVGCLRNGSWTFAPLPMPPMFYGGPPPTLRDLAGTVAVVAYGSVYRFADEALDPIFTDLPLGLAVRDIVSADGLAYLLVGDFRPSSGSVPRVRALVVAAEPGYPAVLTDREDLLYSFDDPTTTLSTTLGRLFVSRAYPTMAATLRDGQLRQARGEAPIGYMDPAGLFASSGSNDLQARGSLLLPVARVRKTLPAVVDTIGQGGVHFRTALALANFSPTQIALARVFPITHPEAVLDVPLPPMTQGRILDPFPEFVGPVAVDFDGLDDEREAWACARVFSAIGAGTAGTSLKGVDPGSSFGFTYLLPPAPEPGTRSHVAVANAGDGAGLPLVVERGDPVVTGELRQRDLDADEAPRVLAVSSRSATIVFPADDLLGYAVRNDDVTNDGTVVSMESPDSEVTRRVRFLPAVVSLTSDAASYRTELRLARNGLHVFTAGSQPFHVLFRSASVSGEFDVEVDALDTTDVPDAAAWLAGNGVAVDPTHVDGTLTFTSDRPEGAADLLVTAAVYATPQAGGDYGVSVPLANEGRWASTSAVVPGLLEDGAFRSNLAVANPEPPGGVSVTLSVSLRRASDGGAVGSLAPVTLRPGERFQFNRVSRGAGLSGSFDGYAVLQRSGGTGRFVAYGVLNDEVTSDGTLLPMTRVE
jgi:hypothetical protein